MSASFLQFCEITRDIAESRGSNAKASIFAAYMRQIADNHENPDDTLNLVTQFIGEGAFSAVSGQRASVGHRTISLCAARFCEIDYEKVFRPSRIATGSASETIEKLMDNVEVARKKRTPENLSIRQVQTIFENIAKARKREEKEAILMESWSKMTPLEIKYFLRIMGGGSLRIGFETRSILGALSEAFHHVIEDIRYAHMITGSLGQTAVKAFKNQLNDAKFRMFQPVAFMLASPAESRVIDNPGEYIAEDKFDGMRCQLHVETNPETGMIRVALYSRDLNDISPSFPEITKIFGDKSRLSPTVLDGEICVFSDNTIQSFQHLQKRMGVKKPSEKLLNQFPVVFIAFDVLYTSEMYADENVATSGSHINFKDSSEARELTEIPNRAKLQAHTPPRTVENSNNAQNMSEIVKPSGVSLFDVPLWKRRQILEKICAENDIRMVTQKRISTEEDVERLFNMALSHGNEGLMLKHKDSVYEFGQRKKSWLKVKRPGGSLDTVILYATAGSGRRGGTYSDFTLGVRVNNDDRFQQNFVPIGKAYGGYTDEQLKRLNLEIKPLIREKFGPTLSLEPKIVVEVEFDEIQVNKRTKAGYTLRFPRFRGIRWDKSVQDTDTLEEVERLYHERANRKRLPQNKNASFQ